MQARLGLSAGGHRRCRIRRAIRDSRRRRRPAGHAGRSTPSHALAAAQRIELIDGAALWPELAPLLPHSLTDDVAHSPTCARQAPDRLGLARCAGGRRRCWSCWCRQRAPAADDGAEPTSQPRDRPRQPPRPPQPAPVRIARRRRPIPRNWKKTHAQEVDPQRLRIARRRPRAVVDPVDAAGATCSTTTGDRLTRDLRRPRALRRLAHLARAAAAAAGQHATASFPAVPDVLSRAVHLQDSAVATSARRASARRTRSARCSARSRPCSAFLSPLAAAESGNSSNAVFITTS